MKCFSYILGFAFLFSSSCVTNPVTGKRDFMLLSTKQEVAMGQKTDPEIVAFFGLYEDKALQSFIDKKGQEMAAISHRSKLDYDFKIVDSPVVNAFAVPGGYVYFTRGIMAYFNNEAEFAGVLGHEIGHIAAKHSARQYSKSMLAQVGLVAGMVISPEFAQFADIAQQGVGLLFLKFGRDAERESDKLGVEYSTKIGYDAEEMAEFFLTLNRINIEQGGEKVPSFLSTHPDPENRYEAVQELAAKWQQKENVANLKVNRNEYLRLIDGLVYGEDPKQGFVEGDIFYHPVLKFKFPIPAQWTFQNTPQQVQMAHTDGRAIMILQLESGNSLETAAQSVLEKNQLKLVESKKISVNGLPSIAMIADQVQEQQTLRTLTYLISYGGNIYTIMGVSTDKDFQAFQSVFVNTMNNFDKLTDPAKLNRKPERIKIETVNNTGTLSDIFRSLQVEQDRMQELAILNGMQLNERVEKGTLVKTIKR